MVGLDRGGDVAGAELDPRHLDAGEHGHARAGALLDEPLHRLLVEREAALVLVQADGDAAGAPVGEQLLHVRRHRGLAHDQLRAVADPLLALEHGDEVALLRLRPERDVADRVVVVGGRVRLPHLDAGLHELAHRRLEVVVAHDAAGDAGRTGARAGLVEHYDVRARPGTARLELPGEVVGGRETVDAGADDDILRRSGDHK